MILGHFKNVNFCIAEKCIHEFIHELPELLYLLFIFFFRTIMNSIFTFIIIGTLFQKGLFSFFSSIVFNLRCSFLIKQFLFLNIVVNLYPLFIYFILFTIDLSTSLFVYTCTNISILG